MRTPGKLLASQKFITITLLSQGYQCDPIDGLFCHQNIRLLGPVSDRARRRWHGRLS